METKLNKAINKINVKDPVEIKSIDGLLIHEMKKSMNKIPDLFETRTSKNDIKNENALFENSKTYEQRVKDLQNMINEIRSKANESKTIQSANLENKLLVDIHYTLKSCNAELSTIRRKFESFTQPIKQYEIKLLFGLITLKLTPLKQ